MHNNVYSQEKSIHTMKNKLKQNKMQKEPNYLREQQIEEDEILKNSKQFEKDIVKYPEFRDLIWGKPQFEKEMKKDDPLDKDKQVLSEIQTIRAKRKDRQKTRER